MPPPPGYEPFLRAICAEPEDDTVRLVYADWLDENGCPARAEFIRLQVAEQHVGHESVRTNHLRVKHGRAWRAELPRTGVDSGAFRRGFVDVLHFKNVRYFREHADAMLAATPATDLRIENFLAADVDIALASPHVGRVREVNIQAGGAADDVLVKLAGCDGLGGLERLWLGGRVWDHTTHTWLPTITARGALALIRSPRLARLRRVTLWGFDFPQEVADEFRQRFGTDGYLS